MERSEKFSFFNLDSNSLWLRQSKALDISRHAAPNNFLLLREEYIFFTKSKTATSLVKSQIDILTKHYYANVRHHSFLHYFFQVLSIDICLGYGPPISY